MIQAAREPDSLHLDPKEPRAAGTCITIQKLFWASLLKLRDPIIFGDSKTHQDLGHGTITCMADVSRALRSPTLTKV